MNAAKQPEITPKWADVQERLRVCVGEEKFSLWFETTTGSVEQSTDGVCVLRLVVPNKFQSDWIGNNYGSVIEALWRTVSPNGTVIFAVQEQEPAKRAQQKLPAQVIQFPLFPAEVRPASNNMARSALFSCVQGKDRQMLENALLASQDGIEIRFTGRQLNQDDHDLLMQLVHMGSHKPLGEYTTVPANAILTALSRATGGKQHKQLHADITRLMACVVNLRDTKRRVEYLGHLIDEAAQDETSRYWTFKFNPKLRPLYDDNAYTLIDWEQRKKLRGKDLARWLHLYIATHAAPFPVSVAYLQELSGSQTSTLRKFRQLLTTALNVLKANKDIEDYYIDKVTDLVHINRGEAVTDSQQRHLERPKRRGRPPKKQTRY